MFLINLLLFELMKIRTFIVYNGEYYGNQLIVRNKNIYNKVILMTK